MASGPRYSTKFRRRRDGKTNYKKRLAQIKSKTPRLVIRKSNQYIICQIIKYDTRGDKCVTFINSSKLKKLGWKHSCKNIPAAYLAGYILGKTAKEKNVILDTGLYTSTKGSKVYAALKGAIDAGLNISHNPKILPTEDRIIGQHIATYQKDKKDISKDIEKVKVKIGEKNETKKPAKQSAKKT